MAEDDPLPPCVGICMIDPDSGYCLGCGKPPAEPPGIVAEEALRRSPPPPLDPAEAPA